MSDRSGQVRIASEDDADEVASILAAAFTNDPIFSWIFDEPGRHGKLAAMFGFSVPRGAMPSGATFVLPGAAACWTPPDAPPWPRERFKQFVSVLVEAASPDELTRLSALQREVDRFRPSGRNWRLASIAVLPSQQGEGFGSRLLEAGLEVVDREGQRAYLESTNPRNVPLYERYGFEVTEHVPLAESGPTLTGMMRPARR